MKLSIQHVAILIHAPLLVSGFLPVPQTVCVWSAPHALKRTTTDEASMAQMEQEVVASVEEKMDIQRVGKALNKAGDNSLAPTERWKVALAAASSVSTLALVTIHNEFLAMVAFAGTFVVANRNPLEEEDAAGAAARLVGRVAIKNVSTYKPKVRAMARAALSNEDDTERLMQELDRLQNENASLMLWKERRIAVDTFLPTYSLEELKALARRNRIPVGGTKAQLMMRLLEANVLTVMEMSSRGPPGSSPFVAVMD